MLSPSVAAWGSADSAVQDAQLDRGTWASWRPSSEQRCPLSQRHWVTRGDLAFLCISHKNVLRATALWLGPGRLTAQGKWLRRDMCKLPRFTVQSVAETRTRHGREPPVQVSPGQRQIRHRQRLHLLPKCELPELGTPCCQSPRILSLGCRLCVYESVPSSATSPPPTQPRANPGLATYWLCDLRSYNCGHTGHPPPRDRGKCNVPQGCSRVKSAPVRRRGQCWPMAQVQTAGCSAEGCHCHPRRGLGRRERCAD